MTVPPAQREADAFLRALSGADPVETHISLIYVGRDTVWKLKKAVRLRFLDFSAVEARRRFAERELALNARTAPEMYRDVVPLVRTAKGGLAVGEAPQAKTGAEGAVVDWVLRMAAVPSADFLDDIAVVRGLDDILLDAVADAVAQFHLALPPVGGCDAATAMREVADGNAGAAHDSGLPADRIEAWRRDCLAELDALAGWQRGRAQGGFVRRAHGDLHLGNLCLWRGAPALFDALEFDEAMATIDLGYDLAFLLMDLQHRLGRASANRVLNRYVARTGDAALTRGLPVFLSLRAFIRAHVEASRGNGENALGYLDAASGALGRRPSVVVAVGGLPGTGKSTLARALAPELGRAPGALILRSDEIRKRRWGFAPEAKLPPAAYAGDVSVAVFGELAASAHEVAAGGHAIVADATFIDPATREQIERAARTAGVPFVGLWLDAPLDVLEARVAGRSRDASDATVEVLRQAAANSAGAGDWIAIDARSASVALEQARENLTPP